MLKKGKLTLKLYISHRLKLEMALNGLLANTMVYSGQFEELQLWGKITGMYNDYYIAMGLNYKGKYEFPQKVFYYTTSTEFDF